MLWLKGRAAISTILLFIGFQGKAAKGGVWGSGEVSLMPPTCKMQRASDQKQQEIRLLSKTLRAGMANSS